ncbi:MAG: hypothetical protein AAFO07_31560 [Bacteroidota bacterium]
MKKIFFLSLFTLATFTLWSQGGGRIQSMKVAYITNRIGLTTEESEKFWPIYNEHNQKIQQLKRSLRPNNMNFASLSDQEAEDLLTAYMDMEEKQVQLEKELVNDLKAIIGSRRILMLKKAEKEFNQELVKNLQERRANRNNKGGNNNKD